MIIEKDSLIQRILVLTGIKEKPYYLYRIQENDYSMINIAVMWALQLGYNKVVITNLGYFIN